MPKTEERRKGRREGEKEKEQEGRREGGWEISLFLEYSLNYIQEIQ